MAMTALDIVMKPELVQQAWDYFRNVQTKDITYTPLIRAEDRPAIWLNEKTMAQYRGADEELLLRPDEIQDVPRTTPESRTRRYAPRRTRRPPWKGRLDDTQSSPVRNRDDRQRVLALCTEHADRHQGGNADRRQGRHAEQCRHRRAGFEDRADRARARRVTYDLSTQTVMPGLIDTHTHLFDHFDRPPAAYATAAIPETPAQTMLYMVENAHRTLQAGFTTVQSPGNELDKDLRDWINDGRVPGPRILTSLRQIFDNTGSPEEIRARLSARRRRRS
mgnify:CR=1 FL=1